MKTSEKYTEERQRGSADLYKDMPMPLKRQMSMKQ
jgi:hypothetical protein